MPAVDPKKLKRLLITQLMTPFAMQRRLSAGQMGDLVERAMRDPRFDLSASSDDFAGCMNEHEAAEWAKELERSNAAPHLFTSDGAEQVTDEERFGGYTREELQKMSSQRALSIINQIEFEKHAKKEN
jgi:hypothetical protein